MRSLINWLERLAPRERWLVIIGGTFLVIVLLWNFLIAPLNQRVNDLQTQVANTQTLQAWMQARIPALQNTHQMAVTKVANNALLPTVAGALKQASFTNSVAQIIQGNDNTVRIVLKQVPFDDLMAWLVNMWKTYEIQVVDFTLQKTSDKPGIADIVLVLSN